MSKIKVLLCPDKFKFSLTSREVCRIISSQIEGKYVIKEKVLADGGEGSLQALECNLSDAKRVQLEVNNPIFRKIKAHYLHNAKLNESYIEMSKASGLDLLQKSQRNPLKTSTFGTGQLIKNAILTHNSQKVYLFVGGSATNQCGIGMASALGFTFKGRSGQTLCTTAQNLPNIFSIQNPVHNITSGRKFIVACDVKNPLIGHNGATMIFGKQKGGNQQTLTILQNSMKQFSEIIEKHFSIKIKNIEGTGAAGGLGAGALAFLNAKIEGGISTVMKMINFEEDLKAFDIIVTGEGKLDAQTLGGKVVSGVVQKAMQYNKKVIIFCGKSELKADHYGPNVSIISLMKQRMSQDYCIKNAEMLLKEAVQKSSLCC